MPFHIKYGTVDERQCVALNRYSVRCQGVGTQRDSTGDWLCRAHFVNGFTRFEPRIDPKIAERMRRILGLDE